MGFFLLGRERNSGELILLANDLVETREAALERLSSLVATQEMKAKDIEYFIVDFAGAFPVLLVIPAQPDAVPTEGDAGVWETPLAYDQSDAVLDEIFSEATAEVPEVVLEPEPGEVLGSHEVEEPAAHEVEVSTDVSLAEALKRAADTLESEGIQTPPSVGLVELEPWPWESSPVEVSELAPIIREAGEPEHSSDPESAEDAQRAPLDSFEEPSVDGDPLLPSPIPDDDLLSLRPVILGDYPEVPPDSIDVLEMPRASAPDASVEHAGAPHVSRHPVSVLEDLTIVTSDVGHPSISAPVNAGRALTCDDCVYVSTCPNKDESSPDDCGNFQWKSG